MNTKPTLAIILCFLCVSMAVQSQSLSQVGYYHVNGLFSMAVKPGYLVLGNGQIINISDPTNPQLTGQVSIGGFSSKVLIDDDMAWFGTGSVVRLVGVNINNPSVPWVAGALEFPWSQGGIFGMTKSGNHLFLAMGGDGFFAVDVSDPAHPFTVDSLPIESGHQVRDVRVKNNLAYLAHSAGLKVVDVADPSNMRLLHSVGYGYNSLDMDEQYLYAGKVSGGVDVFRLTNPEQPQLVGAMSNTGSCAWDLFCHQGLLFESTDQGGLYAYRFENGVSQLMADFPNTGNGQSFCVVAQDSLVFLIGLVNGVAVLVYDPNGSVGIENLNPQSDIVLYPNPAETFVTISLPAATGSTVQLYDIHGKLIRTEQLQGLTPRLNVSDLPGGTYLLLIQSGSQSWRRRLVLKWSMKL